MLGGQDMLSGLRVGDVACTETGEAGADLMLMLGTAVQKLPAVTGSLREYENAWTARTGAAWSGLQQ